MPPLPVARGQSIAVALRTNLGFCRMDFGRGCEKKPKICALQPKTHHSLKMLAQAREAFYPQKARWRRRRTELLMLQNPGVAVRHKNSIQASRERWIDI